MGGGGGGGGALFMKIDEALFNYAHLNAHMYAIITFILGIYIRVEMETDRMNYCVEVELSIRNYRMG